MLKEKLLEARLKKGLSQEELSNLIGMSQSNYSRRESGLKNISEQEWNKIAKELKVKVEDIKEENPPSIVYKNIKNNSFSFNFGTIHNNMPEYVIDLIEFLKKENNLLKRTNTLTNF